MLKKRHISEVLSEPDIDYKEILRNKNITWDIIHDNIDKPWNWEYVSMYMKITVDILQKYPDKPWDWYVISLYKTEWNDVLENPDIPWVYNNLLNSNSINYNIISSNFDKFTNWLCISANSNITIKDIIDNPDKPWNFEYITVNPNITPQNIIDYPNLPWDWRNIHRNINMTFELIKDIPVNKLYWRGITSHQNITQDIIDKNPDKPWIKYQIINYKLPKSLRSNIFEVPFEKIRKYFAIKTIWRYWFQANTNPEYMICRHRLLKESQEKI